MFGFIKKIIGTAQSRKVKKYYKIVKKINSLEFDYQKLTDEELQNKTLEFKKRYQSGESLDSILPEAFATVKNACRRLCGTEVHVSGYNQKWDMVPYDVQLVGAIAMHYGAISEMQTGEGKTLTASLALYLNALSSKPVHLVTVNDYLAQRDCDWMGAIFRKLGLSVSALINAIPPHERKAIYQSDIVYGTASEFGFDYLRDNSMASRKEEQCQRRPYYFAIIDEIDSILIDEARTPLIISGPAEGSKQMYDELKSGVERLVRIQRDFCNQLASEARKTLINLKLLSEDENAEPPKLSKEQKQEAQDAYKKLWLVNKGTPRNKVLKRVKENPDMRAEIDHWETYFYSEQNKLEKQKTLAELYIIVDERANEYELTDRGIAAWNEFENSSGNTDPFIMMDLVEEYNKIDENPSLKPEEKTKEKIAIREEDAKRKERTHNLQQLFRAHLLMENDVDYIVQENKIIIIDENTGRPQPGRRFSDGLHQAIEAKESLEIQGETQTYATITLQNYFRMYEKIAGMTGTAITEAGEFKEIYKLEVLEIPTYCPCQRVDNDDLIFMTEREKYASILKEIQKIHDKGAPILIGTESVEISEKLSRILKQAKLPHVVLNAKNHANEAAIIAEAGKKGSITLATNMAGRGTDIKLKEGTKELGGLHVIGTSRHHSRRIDRQLRGRSGRLGDPGYSQFFVSFEDSLLRIFASPRLTTMLQRFRPPEGEPISAKVLNKSIETAQKRIEQRNYMIRKHTLEYDDVMNLQRQEIYGFRNDLLLNDNPIALAETVLENAVCSPIRNFFRERNPSPESINQYREYLMANFPVTIEKDFFSLNDSIEAIEKKAALKVIEIFNQKISYQSHGLLEAHPEIETLEKAENILKDVVRSVMIQKIDSSWKEHLLAIDHLRTEVNLRVVGQKDPLMEFKHEAFILFENFSSKLQQEISIDLFRFELVPSEEEKRRQAQLQESLKKTQMKQEQNLLFSSSDEAPQEPIKSEPVVVEEKVGRNDDCPCGSGKKYKKCCAPQ
jgi:preprotein translocase subunit SecA